MFQRALGQLIADPSKQLSPAMITILSDMAEELTAINDRVAELDREIASHSRGNADTRRLMEIPGIGPTIASAHVAAVGDGGCFAKARDLSAWLSLVPRQIATGGKAGLIGISKHGKSYLRRIERRPLPDGQMA